MAQGTATLTQIVGAFIGVVFFLLFIWYQHLSRVRLPQLGPPTIFGRVWTMFRFFYHPVEVLDEARAKFSGRPFFLPGIGVVVGHENVQVLRNEDAVFNQHAAICEIMSMPQTFGKIPEDNRYELAVVRTDIPRAFAMVIPEIVEETTEAFQETLNLRTESDSIAIPVFETMTQLIARISNRMLVGKELCRNPKFAAAMIGFAVKVVFYATGLAYFPAAFRDAVYFVASSIFGSKKEALAFILPVVKECIRNMNEMGTEPSTALEYMVRSAPPDEIANPMMIALRLLTLEFASIHSSSLYLTHALYELATYPEAQLEEFRSQVSQAILTEDGWNKASIARFHKLDSLLREVGRYYGLGKLGLQRMTTREARLPDGSAIPAGYMVSGDLYGVHLDPKLYPNPGVFDPYRFSKFREQLRDVTDAKQAFSTADRDYLGFGGGKHACPGRFFVSMELKVILAHILLNYDISFPLGVKERPKNIHMSGTTLPDMKAKLVFKKRRDAENF